VLVAAGGPVDAEPQLEHVALLDVVQRVLVGAVQVVALAGLDQRAADRHAGGVELVEEAARVALHAEAAQPVGADGLCGSGVGVGWGGVGVGGGGWVGWG